MEYARIILRILTSTIQIGNHHNTGKQICSLVEIKLRSREPMHRFLRWNIANGTLQTIKLEAQNESSTSQKET